MIIVDNEFVGQYRGLILSLLKERTKRIILVDTEWHDLYTDVIVKCIHNAKYHDDKWAMTTFIKLQVRSAVADHVNRKVAKSEKDPLFGSCQLLEEHDQPIEDEESDEDTMDYLRGKLAPFMLMLSDNEHAVIRLHVWDRLSVNDIAEKLDMHASSVSAIKKRAQARLAGWVAGGKCAKKYDEVAPDTTLEAAIMQLPDAEYFACRFHHLKGWSIPRTARMMSRSYESIMNLLESARQTMAFEYGYRL